MGLLLPPGDNSSPSPDLLAQLQALRQPGQQQLQGASLGGGLGQQAGTHRPFASLSCLPDASQQQGGLSISALGGPLGTDTLSTGVCAGLPLLQNAELSAQLAQAQQMQAQAQMPVLQEEAPGGALQEDDGQVAALDGMIDQCLSRLLQLRSQITARRATAAPVGSSCSTPTATAAAAGAAASAQGVLSSTGFTSDSLLQGASQPLLLAQQVQQQHSGMLSPVSSMHGHMQAGHQQLGSNSNLLWMQQQQQPGPSAGNSTMLSAAGLGPACLSLPQGSSCTVAGSYSAQPMPLLGHPQAQLTVLGQQQVLMQPAGMQLTASLGGGDDGSGRGSHGGNFNLGTGVCAVFCLISRAVTGPGSLVS
jgi:hypothetical protein